MTLQTAHVLDHGTCKYECTISTNQMNGQMVFGMICDSKCVWWDNFEWKFRAKRDVLVYLTNSKITALINWSIAIRVHISFSDNSIWDCLTLIASTLISPWAIPWVRPFDVDPIVAHDCARDWSLWDQPHHRSCTLWPCTWKVTIYVCYTGVTIVSNIDECLPISFRFDAVPLSLSISFLRFAERMSIYA